MQKDDYFEWSDAARVKIVERYGTSPKAQEFSKARWEIATTVEADPARVLTALQSQSVVIGQLCVVMAEDSAQKGDLKRARRLLALAEKIDPGNRVHYVRKREALEKEKPR